MWAVLIIGSVVVGLSMLIPWPVVGAEPEKKTRAPDGVNWITDHGGGIKSITLAHVPPAPEPTSLGELIHDAFDTGMKLGYAAAHKGATSADILLLIEMHRKNDHAAFDKWFRDRDPKP